MPVEPIRMPGTVVAGGLRALMEAARARDPEEFNRREREFREALERIREAEVEAWRMLHGTTMGPYR